jgi:hypothetical protein
MSVVKTSAAALAIVLGLAGLANAATRYHQNVRHAYVQSAPVYGAYGAYGYAGGYTYDGLPAPSGEFQDQWKNTY